MEPDRGQRVEHQDRPDDVREHGRRTQVPARPEDEESGDRPGQRPPEQQPALGDPQRAQRVLDVTEEEEPEDAERDEQRGAAAVPEDRAKDEEPEDGDRSRDRKRRDDLPRLCLADVLGPQEEDRKDGEKDRMDRPGAAHRWPR